MTTVDTQANQGWVSESIQCNSACEGFEGFARISLKAGETKTVNFIIDEEKLKIWDRSMQFVAEAGVYEIMIGKSSEEVFMVNYTYKK